MAKITRKKVYICKEHDYLMFSKKKADGNNTEFEQYECAYDKKTEYVFKKNKIYKSNDELECIIEGKTDFPNRKYDSENKIFCYCVNPEVALLRERKAFFAQDILEVNVQNTSEDDADHENQNIDEDELEIENNKIGIQMYRASYLIGAQWVHEIPERKNGKNETYGLVIAPKFDNIDYSDMFMTCLQSGIESEEFSKLYGIDFDSKDGYIYAPSVASALNPLLISHFIAMVERLLKNGLKRDYIYVSENLKKPKGKIDIQQNERKNVIQKRFDRVYCNYSEYSIDIPENRVIKKALIFVKKMLSFEGSSGNRFMGMVRKSLTAFDGVSDQIQVSEIKKVKSNKLFRDYPETVRLAKMILKRYGYSIANISLDSKEVPPFWIDMAGLFEHYTLVKLKQRFGERIMFQCEKGTEGKFSFSWRPDFLMKKGSEEGQIPMILDSKYKRNLRNNPKEGDIRQLSGYSREMRIRKILGIEEDSEDIIPCVFLYPQEPKKRNSMNEQEKTFKKVEFTKAGLKESGCNIKGFCGFYAIPIEVPIRTQSSK